MKDLGSSSSYRDQPGSGHRVGVGSLRLSLSRPCPKLSLLRSRWVPEGPSQGLVPIPPRAELQRSSQCLPRGHSSSLAL